jgi:hypothetical protein
MTLVWDRHAQERTLWRDRQHTLDGERSSTEHHQHFALGAELGDHVRAFVDGPDIVVFIDAHRMGEFKAEKSATDFLDEFAGLVEFEKPVVVASVEDEDVALGISGHRDRLAQVLARREFQEIRHGSKWNFGDILDGRLALRKRRASANTERAALETKIRFIENLLI